MRMMSPNDAVLGFPAPPRTVRRKPWTGGLVLWFVRLFILPHTIAGIVLLLSIPAHLYVTHFGKPTIAVIDARQATPSRKGGFSYEILYHYTLDGRRYDERTSVGQDEYDQAHIGDRFAGRAAALMNHPLFLGPDWQHERILGLIAFALFWNGILSVFIYVVWIVPLRNRWIVRIGLPALGVITNRRIRKGRGGSRYTVFYIFTTADGTDSTGKGQVTNLAYEVLVEGSSITVLYDPNKPKRNLPYDFCEYTITPS